MSCSLFSLSPSARDPPAAHLLRIPPALAGADGPHLCPGRLGVLLNRAHLGLPVARERREERQQGRARSFSPAPSSLLAPIRALCGSRRRHWARTWPRGQPSDAPVGCGRPLRAHAREILPPLLGSDFFAALSRRSRRRLSAAAPCSSCPLSPARQRFAHSRTRTPRSTPDPPNPPIHATVPPRRPRPVRRCRRRRRRRRCPRPCPRRLRRRRQRVRPRDQQVGLRAVRRRGLRRAAALQVEPFQGEGLWRLRRDGPAVSLFGFLCRFRQRRALLCPPRSRRAAALPPRSEKTSPHPIPNPNPPHPHH